MYYRIILSYMLVYINVCVCTYEHTNYTLRQTSILFKPLTVVTVIIKHTVQNKTTEEKLPALNRGMTLRAVHLCAALTKGSRGEGSPPQVCH